LVGPVELQAKIASLHPNLVTAKDINILMSRFGNAAYSGRVDLSEVFAWSRSLFDKLHSEEIHEKKMKKMKEGMQLIVAKNSSVSRAERSKIAEADFSNRLNEKLSLAAVGVLRHEKYHLMETTNPYIPCPEFRSLLKELGIFLSARELTSLEAKYDIPVPGVASKVVDFLAFKYEMVLLGREAVRKARQDEALQAFKSNIFKSAAPPLSTSSSTSLSTSSAAMLSPIHRHHPPQLNPSPTHIKQDVSRATNVSVSTASPSHPSLFSPIVHIQDSNYPVNVSVESERKYRTTWHKGEDS
jgi:hypothetical protein